LRQARTAGRALVLAVHGSMPLLIWDLASRVPNHYDTLDSALRYTPSSFGGSANLGLSSATARAVLVAAAAASAAAPGAVRSSPESGVMRLAGMANLTVAPILVCPTSPFSLGDYGGGF
jgi:hypothetical protein